MKRVIFLIVLSAIVSGVGAQAVDNTKKPVLVINIIISQMRYDYLDRFAHNFSGSGFGMFMDEGIYFRSARYNYMNTNTVAGLGTVSTGANPSEHGAISEYWIDYTTNRRINLIDDLESAGLESDQGIGDYSAYNLSAATLGDRLKMNNDSSKVVSIAADPVSAIVSGGPSARTYWMDRGRGKWISSSYYFENLPLWVTEYNKTDYPSILAGRDWTLDRPADNYVNRDMTVLRLTVDPKPFRNNFFGRILGNGQDSGEGFDMTVLHYTPYGNTIVSNFVREAIVREELGQDAHTDLLTVCYDTPRLVSERFGPRSMEVEDMYYRLDAELADLMGFVNMHFEGEDVVVTLTSDHGSSDTYTEGSRIPMGLFNPQQFKMIMNGFLSAQYEPGEWVLDYNNRQLYLNRNMIYNYGLLLEEVQTRAAAFALQFRGVANAMTSTALQNSYFGKGTGEKIQNSFYPRRSGDITINLLPGWIEEDDGKLSLSGSFYEYDAHVPLMFYGRSLRPMKVDRDVDMTSVAPTLARIMHITPPNASTGGILTEVTTSYEDF